MEPRVAVILITWKRLESLNQTLNSLKNQTYKNFDLYVSHSNKENFKTFYKEIEKFKKQNKEINIEYSIDSNDTFCFRRYYIARRMVNSYEVFFFLDDDVWIPENYLEKSLHQYSEKTYQSGHAYSFTTSPPDYSVRKKYNKKSKSIGYCGAGMSMIDSSIFKEDDFFENDLIYNNYQFDDIWLSYFATTMGWSLNYLDSGAILGGEDDVAMYTNIMDKKNDFVQQLYNSGWRPKVDLGGE